MTQPQLRSLILYQVVPQPPNRTSARPNTVYVVSPACRADNCASGGCGGRTGGGSHGHTRAATSPSYRCCEPSPQVDGRCLKASRSQVPVLRRRWSPASCRRLSRSRNLRSCRSPSRRDRVRLKHRDFGGVQILNGCRTCCRTGRPIDGLEFCPAQCVFPFRRAVAAAPARLGFCRTGRELVDGMTTTLTGTLALTVKRCRFPSA